jgi:hypothetical protein
LGFFVVASSHRGRGIGTLLWHEALRCCDSDLVLLDAVPELEDFYDSRGFSTCEVLHALTGELHLSERAPGGTYTVGPPYSDDLARFVDQAAPSYGWDYVEQWMGLPGTLAIATRKGEVEGLCSVRPGESGWRLGPLIATSEAAARSVLTSISDALGSRAVITAHARRAHHSAVAILEEAGLRPSGVLNRMATKPLRAGDSALMAVASPECG